MNEERQQSSGPGPEGAQSSAKQDSLVEANKSLVDANDRLIKERGKLEKKVAKLEEKVENQKTALKGKTTEIQNLKKKVKEGGGIGKRRLHLSRH